MFFFEASKIFQLPKLSKRSPQLPKLSKRSPQLPKLSKRSPQLRSFRSVLLSFRRFLRAHSSRPTVFFVRRPRAPASRSFVVDGPPAALRRHRERRVEPPREEAASEQVREDAIPALRDPPRPRRPVGFEPGVFRLRAFGFTVVVVVVPVVVVVVPNVVSDAEASRRGDAHRPRGALAGFAREQDEPLRLHEEEGLLRVQE